jgi:hypothetical protein
VCSVYNLAVSHERRERERERERNKGLPRTSKIKVDGSWDLKVYMHVQ